MVLLIIAAVLGTVTFPLHMSVFVFPMISLLLGYSLYPFPVLIVGGIALFFIMAYTFCRDSNSTSDGPCVNEGNMKKKKKKNETGSQVQQPLLNEQEQRTVETDSSDTSDGTPYRTVELERVQSSGDDTPYSTASL